MFIEIVTILILLAILIYLIMSTLRKKRPETEPFSEAEGEKLTECPLCGKALQRGQRVHSVVYNQGEDRLMNIHGCPWCYPGHPGGHKTPARERSCPSCKTPLREGSFAIARVFERPGGKVHVHVLGCPVCRDRKE